MLPSHIKFWSERIPQEKNISGKNKMNPTLSPQNPLGESETVDVFLITTLWGGVGDDIIIPIIFLLHFMPSKKVDKDFFL